MLVCWDLIYTLEITARILREVVNRERLCGTNTQALWLPQFLGLSDLVAWLREFCCTLEIITRTLREVVNRERLCDTNAFYFGGFLVAWLREFCCTLEIIARTLREVVNRVRLCGHHSPFEVFAW